MMIVYFVYIFNMYISATTCTYSPGDIVGKEEVYVGNTNSPAECDSLVRKVRPMASGMTWGDPILMEQNDYLMTGGFINGLSAHGRCYAEFGNEIGSSENYRTCLYDRKIAL